MVVLALVLAVVLVALGACYGRTGFVRLSNVQFEGGWFAGMAVLAQVLHTVLPQHRLALVVVSAVSLAVFCWRNRRHIGIPLAAMGILLNMLAMAANGGHMPLNPDALARMDGNRFESGTTLLYAKNQVLTDHDAVLPWLGDRLVLPGPFAHIAVWSIGDVLLIAGVCWFLWSTMKGTVDELSVRAVSPRA